MALRLDSSSPRNIWWHLGISYYLKAQYEKAMRILEEGLIKRPDFVGYHIALAATYARLGQNQKAEQAAASIRRLDPFFDVEAFGIVPIVGVFPLPFYRAAFGMIGDCVIAFDGYAKKKC